MIQEPLFGGMSMRDGVEYAVSGLAERLRTHRNLVVAFSGGKDSTAMLTFVVWAITTGRVPKPDSFRILCVDTRLELPPLMASVRTLIEEARERIEESGLGIEFEAKIVCAPVRRRILVYMLGTGVPPATSTDLRWCTRIAKADPAEEQLAVWRASAPDTLVLTGLRIGESAARDLRRRRRDREGRLGAHRHAGPYGMRLVLRGGERPRHGSVVARFDPNLTTPLARIRDLTTRAKALRQRLLGTTRRTRNRRQISRSE